MWSKDVRMKGFKAPEVPNVALAQLPAQHEHPQVKGVYTNRDLSIS